MQTVYQLQFLAVHAAALFKRNWGEKSQAGGPRKTQPACQLRKRKRRQRKEGGTNPPAFVAKRTNEAAVRTVLSDTTSHCTHTHCGMLVTHSNERGK